MLVEEDAELFKKWTTQKLETLGIDADHDILSDFVVALVTTDEPEPQARLNCLDQLQDFLGDHTQKFVDEAFASIKSKSYDPSKVVAKPTASLYGPPRRQSTAAPQSTRDSRKRSWAQDVDSERSVQSYEGYGRAAKQPRRGAGHWREPRGGRQNPGMRSHNGVPPSFGSTLAPPTPPPGMPPFDPNDPFAAMLAMQQVMMGLPMPDMSSLGNGTNAHAPANGSGKRCRDYDNKGFCTRGASCPYEHGENPFVVPSSNDEYDPNDATSMFPTSSRAQQNDASFLTNGSTTSAGRGGVRGRGNRGFRGGRGRSGVSHTGPIRDPHATTIVVEQIPEDKFDEASVRGFFDAFGTVAEVTMQPHKRLAIVNYDSHDSAQAAYNSPKSVFDNRFVKVYWYRPETVPKPPDEEPTAVTNEAAPGEYEMHDTAEPEIDMEEVRVRQEEAQRKHDEAKKQRELAQKQKLDLDQKLRAMDLERKRMAELLAKKSTRPTDSPKEVAENDPTQALKAQLAKLEAEAESLGIDPNAPDTSTTTDFYISPNYRGRGGYRGRGAPRGRAGYWNAFSAPQRVKPTKSLDNRPKTVSITFPLGAVSAGEEGLRQYLMLNDLDSTASVTKHPEREDTVLITFQQRFEGENLMVAATGYSDLARQLGKVDLGWVTDAAVLQSIRQSGDEKNGHGGAEDVQMDGDVEQTAAAPQQQAVTLDTYDEQDDMDRWA